MLNIGDYIFRKSPPKTDTKKGINDNVNEIIYRIKNGDDSARNTFINQYMPFIIKSISRNIKGYVDTKNSEELSVGLEAFNDAIDSFDVERNVNFFSYADLLIKRRLIDYIRTKAKDSKLYPFSYYENEDENFYERNLETHEIGYEEVENFEEILDFEKRLKEFGIKLENLPAISPKHEDSIELCVKLAKAVANDEELFSKLQKNKRLPRNELVNLFGVHRRTIENNRKFIIALCLILRSNLNIMKNYVLNIGR